MASRELYIDRLRTAMTTLVIFHHTAITYGGSGGWFYREFETTRQPSSLLLTFFCATNQAWFMGFFFFIAGYFTPGALDRKGYSRFLIDRILRLGLPLAFFVCCVGPLTVAISHLPDGVSLGQTIQHLWQKKPYINGPLWFAQALLIFSISYVLWRLLTRKQNGQFPTPIPTSNTWRWSAIAVGLAALTVRQIVPVGENIFGLQLGYFPSYIFLFAAGITAWRHNWLAQLDWRQARPWLIRSLLVWVALPIAILFVFNGGSSGQAKHASFDGGMSWASMLYALWEPFVAWGLIAAALVWFREHCNQPSALQTWLSRRAYAVYIIHPPVLVGIALLLRQWHVPALIKFGITGTLVCAACWLIADPLVRLPGLRRIL